MSKREVIGTCHICGAHGPLTFEHVPPQKAFNDQPMILLGFDAWLHLGPFDELDKRGARQGGLGAHTLCGRCNNDMGGWYARAFIDWCKKGMAVLERSGGHPRLVYAQDIYPLRVIKQIVAMFFSVNGPDFQSGEENAELVRFLKNKTATGIPDGLRFYAYYHAGGRTRMNPAMVIMDVEQQTQTLLSEIAFPPYGYVMTIDSPPPDERLVDITHFAFYRYDERAIVSLPLPLLETHLTWQSGDYRAFRPPLQTARNV